MSRLLKIFFIANVLVASILGISVMFEVTSVSEPIVDTWLGIVINKAADNDVIMTRPSVYGYYLVGVIMFMTIMYFSKKKSK